MESADRPLPAPPASTPAEPAQYLTFMLGTEAFAMAILSIKEIIEYHELTAVPLMPDCVRGVINLRGAVVPVIDLQTRLGRPASPLTRKTCIVVVETRGRDGEPQVVGAIVDVVNEVLEIAAADIEQAPAFGNRIRADFIAGIGKVRGRFVILLEVDAVLAVDRDEAPDAATPDAGPAPALALAPALLP